VFCLFVLLLLLYVKTDLVPRQQLWRGNLESDLIATTSRAFLVHILILFTSHLIAFTNPYMGFAYYVFGGEIVSGALQNTLSEHFASSSPELSYESLVIFARTTSRKVTFVLTERKVTMTILLG
jgi:hypothetical protein